MPDEELEQELRLRLGRIEPPRGFKARVMARVKEREALPNRSAWFRHPVLIRAIAASLVVVAGLGFYAEREYQQRVEGERAKQQVMLALHITGQTLQAVQSRVNSSREEEDK